MEKQKVALSMIAKDKADIIGRALESTQGIFDLYTLQDTGSSDNTIEVFTKWCEKNNKPYRVRRGELVEKNKLPKDSWKATKTDKYGVGKYRYVLVDNKKTLANFAAARNDSFKLVDKYEEETKDVIDFGFWIDTDDVGFAFEQLPALADFCARNNIAQAILGYDYAKPVDGMSAVTQQRERLINRRIKNQWFNWVHENNRPLENGMVILPEQLQQMGIVMKVVHERSPHESLATNRRNNLIMRMQLEEEGMDNFPDDMLQHLAFDHWEHKEYDESNHLYEILLERYSKQKVAPETLYQVHIRIAQAYFQSGKYSDAIKHGFKCIEYIPQIADGYLILGEAFSEIQNWSEAEYYADKVLRIGKPQTTAPVNEFEYTVVPLRIKLRAAVMRNDLTGAKKIAKELTRMLPSNPQVKSEFFNLEREERRQNTIKAIGELTLFYQENGLVDQLDKLRQAIPIQLLDDDLVRSKIKEIVYDEKHKARVTKFSADYQKTIVIYAGQGYEDWDGESDVKKGIGGSEGMCIQLSRELAKLGNKVFVYNSCGQSDGKSFDGVTYYDHRKWNPDIKSDIFISLRVPGVFSALIKATKTFLWLHDTEYGEVEQVILNAPNKVIVLSDFHKQIIKQNHGVTNDNLFWVSRNGLNKLAVEYGDQNAKERNPFKIIYASSYDRGLMNLLDMWPMIKEAVPQAESDIFYGTLTMDKMIEMQRQHNPQYAQYLMHFKSQLFEKIKKLDGVRELGRISQNELYKKFKESSIWAYPTEFQEISCITAMTAQAMGAVPVCSPFAALNETVSSKYGIKVELDKYAKSLIYMLQNQEELESRRQPMMDWARKQYDMAELAKEWNAFFNNN